jgi:hypothetical protein
MADIFISYRRDDSLGHTGRLFDRLASHFGPDHVFMDVEAILPGMDFVETIQTVIGRVNVLIVVIGRTWLSSQINSARRLDDPNDYVRLEIQSALDRKISVIPVLVHGASMPRQRELPEPLAALARRHAIELSDTRWQYDTDRLIAVLDSLVPSQRQPVATPESPEAPSRQPTRSDAMGLIQAFVKSTYDYTPAIDAIERVDRRTARWRGTLPLDMDTAVRRLERALQRSGVGGTVEREENVLHMKPKYSFESLGEHVQARLDPVKEQETQITITSRSLLKATLFDYGKNKKNIERIVVRLVEDDILA